jgi:hypothetical protein
MPTRSQFQTEKPFSWDNIQGKVPANQMIPGFIEETGYRLGFLERSVNFEHFNGTHMSAITRTKT